jgi:hypothetical protein
MARANNHGWDFVKVGKTYQYKEDWFIAMVTIIEDSSDDEEYRFKLKVEKANAEPPQNGEFEIAHMKEPGGYWSGMLQFFENEDYFCDYKWERNKN